MNDLEQCIQTFENILDKDYILTLEDGTVLHIFFTAKHFKHCTGTGFVSVLKLIIFDLLEKFIIYRNSIDEFCMCSCADILRKLMLIGAEQLHTNAEQAEGKG